MVPANRRSRPESAVSSRCRSRNRRLGAQPLFERELEAAAQFGSSLAREGDGGHVLDGVVAGLDAGCHAHREAVGLPGSSPGLDEEVLVELGDEPISNGLVRRRLHLVTHGCAASGTARARAFSGLSSLRAIPSTTSG